MVKIFSFLQHESLFNLLLGMQLKTLNQFCKHLLGDKMKRDQTYQAITKSITKPQQLLPVYLLSFENNAKPNAIKWLLIPSLSVLLQQIH